MDKKKRKRVTQRQVDEQSKKPLSLSFEQAYEYFYSSKKAEGLREPTLISYKEHFGFFMNWKKEYASDITMISELTTVTIRNYLNYLRNDHFNYKTKERGLAIQTCNARIRFLKTFYSFLSEENFVEENPTEKVKLIKEDEKTFKPLNEKEMDKLLAVPDVNQYPQFRDKCIMYLMYDTALRIKEAISLTKDNLDLVNRRLILNANQAKARKARFIPLSSYTVKLLIELVSENDTHFDTNYLFLNWYGEHMAEDTFRRNLNRYAKKAGIERGFTPHDFRRQAITEMLANGASLFTVMSIAGHAKPETTKRYVHFDETMIKNQHDLYSPVAKKRNKRKR